MTDTRKEQKHQHRQRLYDQQQGKCYFCEQQMFLTFQHVTPQPLNLAVFHKLNESGNTVRVLCCYVCGQKKVGQTVGVCTKGIVGSRRKNLYQKFEGKCYWCKREVFLAPQRKNPPPNLATIDHIYHKRSPHRREPEGGKVVLACFECNHRRGEEHSKIYSIRLPVLNNKKFDISENSLRSV